MNEWILIVILYQALTFPTSENLLKLFGIENEFATEIWIHSGEITQIKLKPQKLDGVSLY